VKFDARLTELVAIGASVTASCHACVTHHFGKARESGVEQDEIAPGCRNVLCPRLRRRQIRRRRSLFLMSADAAAEKERT
jgi:AhpD family alkylhydroperoxidase